jgi:hypothetical protein
MATVLGLVNRAGRPHIAADLSIPREVLGIGWQQAATLQ